VVSLEEEKKKCVRGCKITPGTYQHSRPHTPRERAGWEKRDWEDGGWGVEQLQKDVREEAGEATSKSVE